MGRRGEPEGIVMGESTDMLSMFTDILGMRKDGSNALQTNPRSHSSPPHVLLHFHPSTRSISFCQGVHTILHPSNCSTPFHGIPFHGSNPSHALFVFIFLILDTICTICPYSPRFHLLPSPTFYTYFPAFNSFAHLLLHV